MTVMECLLAWWMHHPDRLPVSFRPSFAYYYDYFQEDLLQFDARYAVYDTGLFYTLKPESRFSFRNIEFDNEYRTNRVGLRDGDSILSSAQVICLGDSYTMGWGVEQDSSFPVRLAALSGWKVANLGMASYGTARELKGLGRVDTSKLRCLIIQYCCNDQGENLACQKHGYKLPISSRDTYEDLVRAARSSRIYFPGKYFLIIGNFFGKSLLNKIYPFFSLPWERKDWGKGQEDQARIFLDLLYHSGINFGKLKVVITMMDDPENMQGTFLKEAERLSMQMPYRERFGKGLLFMDAGKLLTPDDHYILDAHFKASGHEKIARALSKLLTRDLPSR